MTWSGWRIAGEDIYTCVPPPGYEVDPGVLRAVHEFDPGVIPIWRLQVWIRPNSEERETFVHGGISRCYPHPRYLRKPFHVEMPARVDHPIPNFLDAIFEDQSISRFLFEGGPGGYIPWNWATYYWCRAKYMEITLKAFDQLMEAKRERAAKMRQDWQDEIEGRKAEIEPFLMRKAAEISDPEWDNYLALMKHRKALRARGIKPPPIKDTNPFVDLSSGRSPRPLGKTYGQVAPAQELNK